MANVIFDIGHGAQMVARNAAKGAEPILSAIILQIYRVQRDNLYTLKCLDGHCHCNFSTIFFFQINCAIFFQIFSAIFCSIFFCNFLNNFWQFFPQFFFQNFFRNIFSQYFFKKFSAIFCTTFFQILLQFFAQFFEQFFF